MTLAHLTGTWVAPRWRSRRAVAWPRPVRILVLGGTVFVGRHIVEEACGRGHRVTTFSRGIHDTDLPAGVERLCGDRRGGLSPLRNRTWDAVIDTCGYRPQIVASAASMLARHVEHYA